MTDSTATPAPAPVGALASISLDCADPAALADFYGRLLGMRRIYESPDGALVALSNGGVAVTMMRTPDHVPPTWPAADLPKQIHLDVSVTDLDESVAGAVALGATVAGQQTAPHVSGSCSIRPGIRSASPRSRCTEGAPTEDTWRRSVEPGPTQGRRTDYDPTLRS